MATYKIVRVYADMDIPKATIRVGLTLSEAQAHCKDPETCSSTCKGPGARRRTAIRGPWFDGFEEEN